MRSCIRAGIRGPGGLLLVALLAPFGASGQIELESIATGLPSPVYAAAPAGDTRLFLVERAGRIRIHSGGSVLATPFLDLQTRVSTGGEQGLFGLAFPDDYAATGLFYVYYTDLAGDSVVSRFRRNPANANQALAASEEQLLVVPQPFDNHNGGTIAFSPVDGYLYFSPGDGGSGNDPAEVAQDPTSLLGKMLRIDVSGGVGTPYTIPPGNPFAGAADPGNQVRDEIWAFGLRNPFRFGFDRATGDLWIGDVGQGAREEVDFEPPGAGGRNYGWDVFEGTLVNPNDPAPGLSAHAPVHTPPLHQYDHDSGCSITGGTVYRGGNAALDGLYFFGDWCTGTVWTLDPDTGAVVNRSAELAAATGGVFRQPIAFGEDGEGQMVIVSLLGSVWRIVGEAPGPAACANGLDDDGDGQTDYFPGLLGDQGCTSASDDSEREPGSYLVCDDGIDNDGDGAIDFPADPECVNAVDLSEASGSSGGCGLGGELVIALVAWRRTRRRRGRTARV